MTTPAHIQELTDAIKANHPSVTFHDAYDIATLVWSLAIEEAAKVADGENYHGAWRTWSFYKPDAMGNRMNDDINGGNLSRHSDNIAAAIRALAVEG